MVRRSLFCAHRASPAQAGLAIFSLGASPHEVAFHEVMFAVLVCGYAEEDAASSLSERVVVSVGHRNVFQTLV